MLCLFCKIIEGSTSSRELLTVGGCWRREGVFFKVWPLSCPCSVDVPTTRLIGVVLIGFSGLKKKKTKLGQGAGEGGGGCVGRLGVGGDKIHCMFVWISQRINKNILQMHRWNLHESRVSFLFRKLYSIV